MYTLVRAYREPTDTCALERNGAGIHIQYTHIYNGIRAPSIAIVNHGKYEVTLMATDFYPLSMRAASLRVEANTKKVIRRTPSIENIPYPMNTRDTMSKCMLFISSS